MWLTPKLQYFEMSYLIMLIIPEHAWKYVTPLCLVVPTSIVRENYPYIIWLPQVKFHNNEKGEDVQQQANSDIGTPLIPQPLSILWKRFYFDQERLFF